MGQFVSTSWKKCLAAIALAGLLLPGSAFALSFGDMTLESHFSEPLKARIAIPNYTPDELETLKIALAGKEVFELQGVLMADILLNVRFSLEKDNRGTPFISVVTNKPIEELALSMFVEFSWSQGRLIRAYDLLISPPLEQFNTSSFKELLSSRVFPDTESATADVVTVVALPGVGDANEPISYGPVKPGESLSKIAQRMRPDQKMNLQAVMLALFKENPEAFNGDNINGLKAGVTLYLRNISAVYDLDADQAKREALRHLETWELQDNTTKPVGASAQQTPAQDPEAVTADQDAQAGTSPRLKIVSGDVDQILASTSEGLDLEALRNQLSILIEESESLRIENSEMEQAIARLEEIIANQRLELDALKENRVSILAKNDAVYTDDLVNAPSDISFSEEETSYLSEILGVLLIVLGLVALGIVYTIRRKQSKSPYADLTWVEDLKMRLFKRDKTHYIG